MTGNPAAAIFAAAPKPATHSRATAPPRRNQGELNAAVGAKFVEILPGEDESVVFDHLVESNSTRRAKAPPT